MGDDDVLHALGRDAERLEPFARRLDDVALALLRHRLVEAGVDHESAVRPRDRPDVKIDRLLNVVRIAADVVLRGTAFVTPVLDGVDFMHVAAHPGLPCFYPAHTR